MEVKNYILNYYKGQQTSSMFLLIWSIGTGIGAVSLLFAGDDIFLEAIAYPGLAFALLQIVHATQSIWRAKQRLRIIQTTISDSIPARFLKNERSYIMQAAAQAKLRASAQLFLIFFGAGLLALGIYGFSSVVLVGSGLATLLQNAIAYVYNNISYWRLQLFAAEIS
ncbi:MAG: hypothetical protein AAF738_03135 [Bacteroidota bacterium]